MTNAAVKTTPASIKLVDLKEVLLKRALEIKAIEKQLDVEMKDIKSNLAVYINLGETLTCAEGTVKMMNGKTTFTYLVGKEQEAAIKADLVASGKAGYKTGAPYLEFNVSKTC